AEERESAELYLDNPGYGGDTLWRATASVDDDRVLDLSDYSSGSTAGMEALADATGLQLPCGIGLDEWIPQACEEIAAAGYDWVKVRESYPENSTTWIYVGGPEPEMEEV